MTESAAQNVAIAACAIVWFGLVCVESYGMHLRSLARERRHHLVEFLSHLVDVFLR